MSRDKELQNERPCVNVAFVHRALALGLWPSVGTNSLRSGDSLMKVLKLVARAKLKPLLVRRLLAFPGSQRYIAKKSDSITKDAVKVML